MGQQTKLYLKNKFKRGDKPTQQDFADLIDSTFILADDVLASGQLPSELSATLNDHISNKDNPHADTKEHLGLGNVDNTSNLDKPVSNAMQQAMDEHMQDYNNPHKLTKEQLGITDFELPSWLEYKPGDTIKGVLKYRVYDDHLIEFCFTGMKCGREEINSFIFEEMPFELYTMDILPDEVTLKINGNKISFYNSANKVLYGVRKFYACQRKQQSEPVIKLSGSKENIGFFIKNSVGNTMIEWGDEEETILLPDPDLQSVVNDHLDIDNTITVAGGVTELAFDDGCGIATLDISNNSLLTALSCSSDQLTSLSVGNNRMLGKLNIMNCSNLVQTVDLSGCENIEEVYAQDTSVTTVKLPSTGKLRQLHLPGTLTVFTLKNQPLAEENFELQGMDRLTAIHIENSNGIDSAGLISRCLAVSDPVLSRVRLIWINWQIGNLDLLEQIEKWKGLDANGQFMDAPVLTGKCHVQLATKKKLAEMRKAFPELEITYAELKVETTTFVFKSSQNKTIVNGVFTCNFEYEKVDEYTYKVAAEDSETIVIKFKCDNHVQIDESYVVLGTRMQNYTVTYIPLRTIRMQVYGKSVYPSGMSVVINGQNYITDTNGYVYYRGGEAISGMVSASGYLKDPFSLPATSTDATNVVYVYEAVEVKFIVTTDIGSAEGAIVKCGNKQGVVDASGECIIMLGQGKYSYTVTCKNCIDYSGTITVSTSAIKVIVNLAFDVNTVDDMEDGTIQLSVTGLSQTLTIRSTATDYIIDWGDGVTDKASEIGDRVYNHTYDNDIIHRIKISNCDNITKCNALQDSLVVYMSIGNSKISGLHFNSFSNLKSVGKVFKNDVKRAHFSSCFSSCSKLTSIPEGLFANCPNVTGFSDCFYWCSKLTSIPEGLFANCPNVTSFTGCFSLCFNLTSIPEGLFANCPNVMDFSSCFSSCINFTSIPEGLFANCPNVKRFPECFYLCRKLTSIPERLFANCPNVVDFSRCFSSCRDLTSIPAGLFVNCSNVTNFSYCFYWCCNLTSISEGLFANCPNVTNFSYCFNSCGNLTSIPKELFADCSNVTNFSYCFDSCGNLTSIPEELFADCSNVVDFSYCFNSCGNLTSIPEELFANCPNVVDFSYCFNSCSNLTSIPEGLFANCLNVVDFSYCFNSCSNLSSIPEGLFANCPNVTNFSHCFYRCNNLTSIPEKLFANCQNVTDFLCCFESCSNLTSIPEKLFTNCPNVTFFSYCFSSCSNLTLIPEELFANCPNVTNFSHCFYRCSNLTSIPEKLFTNCSNIKYFDRCFSSCSHLTSIPEKLFANCSNVTDFYCCFSSCSHLTSIPEKLFTNCPNVTDFSYCFNNCTNVVSSLPALWILYYGKKIRQQACFLGCSNASNWLKVPKSWGGEASEYTLE